MIPNRISIVERPECINNKAEFGHWEGDSIVCSQSTVSLNVMAERQTQYVSIRRVGNRGAEVTKDAIAASHGERTRGLVVPSRRRSVVLSESER
jgi:IS30 family transposase